MMRALKAAGVVVLGVALLLLGLTAWQLRTSPALAVLIRNTPGLAWAERLLPPAPALRFSVVATPGDARLSGALYEPVDGAYTGVLLVNGVEVPGGWRNPDIETFARSIAELGEAVYVPDLPGGLERGTVTLATRRALDEDLAWFHAQLHGRPVSLVGVCVGGSLGLLAAERQPAEVKAVIALDPYALLSDLLLVATTGIGPGPSGRPAPFDMAAWVRLDLARSVALTLPDHVSRREMQRALLDAPPGQPFQPFRDRPAPPELSQAGRALWRLYGNRQASRFARLFAALPDQMRADLAALSPLNSERRLLARVLIAAPVHDFAFPAGEARQLRRAGPALVSLGRSSALDHVTPSFSLGLLAGYWRLWQFATAASQLMR